MFAFRFALRNVTSRRSSLIIILFIALSIGLLLLSNAIFDGTDHGIDTTFVNSFTGDIVIRPKASFPLSLFGDETPVTGELSEIPHLIPYPQIEEAVREKAGIKSTVSQITGMAALNCNGDYIPSAIFGVPAEEYLKTMSAITLVEGRPFTDEENGAMISKNRIRLIQETTGIELHVGDTLQLITAGSLMFSIRAVTITGIYDYAVQNSVLDQILLTSASTVRSLMDIVDSSTDESTIAEDTKHLLGNDLDLEDLFDSCEDFEVEEDSEEAGMLPASEAQDLSESEESPASEAAVTEQAAAPKDSAVWSFIICKAEEGAKKQQIIRDLNRLFRKNGWDIQAVDWRTAAGGTVHLIFYMRLIFNIGIILILLTGFIVVCNTLTISALDRVQETGTIRSLGADRFFIRQQFFFETLILTLSAGILGCLLGTAVNAFITHHGIHLANTFLIQLFGGSTIQTIITVANVARCMLLSVILAFVGAVYPMHIALKCNPVTAMRGAL